MQINLWSSPKDKNEVTKLENAKVAESWFHTSNKTLINGGAIYTGSISADKLSIGMHPNLIVDGLDSFEQLPDGTPSGWTIGSQTAVSIVSDTGYDGKKALRMAGKSDTDSSNSYFYLGHTTNTKHTYETGKTYIYSFYAKSSVATDTPMTISVTPRNGSSLVTTQSTTVTVKANSAWTRYYFKAPKITSATTHVNMYVRITKLFATNEYIWFDAFQWEEVPEYVSEPSPFKPAGTTVINGGNITAGSISFNSANYGGVGINSSGLTMDGTKAKITINSTDGIKIVRKSDSKNVFYVDSNGDVVIDGKVTIGSSTTFESGYDPTQMQIGGRNLIVNSDTLIHSNYRFLVATGNTIENITSDTPFYNTSDKVIKITTAAASTNVIYRLTNVMKTQGYYTLSFWFKSAVAGTAQTFKADINDFGTKTYTANDVWNKAVVTVNNTRIDSTYNFVDIEVTAGNSVLFYQPKLEMGNKATEWSPAPEDVIAELGDLDSRLVDMTTDGKLTPLEKRSMKQQLDAYSVESVTLNAQGTKYNLATEVTAYTNAYNALNSVLSPLIANLTTTSTVSSPTDLQAKFKDYADKKALLIKAVTDKAKDMGDIALELGTQGLLTVNPIFADWNGTYPTGTANWNGTPIREKTLTRSGNGLRFNVTADTTQAGVALSSSFFSGNQVCQKYLYLEVDYMLVSGAITGSCIILDWGGMTATANANRVVVNLSSNEPAPLTGKWYTMRRLIRRPVDTPAEVAKFTGMAGFALANWASSDTNKIKDLIFDRILLREATAEEIKAYESDIMITDMANDNKLTPNEKVDLKRELAIITAEKAQVENQALAFGISTEKTAFTSAYNALNTYVTPLIADISTTSSIVGSDLTNKMKDYYDKKAALQKAITDASKTYADSIQVGGVNMIKNSNFSDGVNNWSIFQNIAAHTAVADSRFGTVAEITSDSGTVDRSPAYRTVDYDVVTGETYTLSFWIKRDSDGVVSNLFKMMDSANTQTNPLVGNDTTVAANTWYYYTETIKVPTGIVKLYPTIRIKTAVASTKFWIANVKFEKGNRATDWSPSNYDTDTRINKNKALLDDIMSDMKVTPVEKSTLKTMWDNIKYEQSQITAQADSLGVSRTAYNTAYTNLNGTSPKIEAEVLASMTTTYTFASTTLRDTFKSQMNTYNSEAQKLRKAITDKVQSNASSASTSASNANTKIDNLKIGGTNLVRYGGNFKDTSGWSLNGSSGTLLEKVTVDGFSVLHGKGSISGYGVDVTNIIKPDTEYRYSMEIKLADAYTATSNNPAHMWLGTSADYHGAKGTLTLISPASIPANTWTRVVVSVKTKATLPTGTIIFKPFVYGLASTTSEFWLKNVQFEEGNRETAWSPSVEDVQGVIDDINVGSRNYVLDTATPFVMTPLNNTTNQVAIGLYSLNESFFGKQVTISFDYKFSDDAVMTDTSYFVFQLGEALNWVQLSKTIKDRSGRHVNTVTVPTPVAGKTDKNFRLRVDYVSGGNLTISNMKIELGNKATDWTPAPEDITKYISAVESVANTAKSNYDNLSIGGRNLFQNSATFDTYRIGSDNSNQSGFAKSVADPDGAYNVITFPNGGNIYFYPNMKATRMNGKTYTISLEIKTTKAFKAYWYSSDSGTNKYSALSIPNTNGVWQRWSYTYLQTVDSAGDKLFGFSGAAAGDVISLRKLKIEEGNKATDWSPAPEDVDALIDAVEATADKAKADIADMSSDAKLSPVEKVQLKKEWAVILSEKPQYEALANTFGNTTEKNAYITTYNNLNAIVPGYLSSMSTASDIDGPSFRSKFDDYYDKKAQLIKAVTTKSKTLADGAQSSIDNLVIGGRNYYNQKSFAGAGGATASFDSTTGVWNVTFASGSTGSWRGIYYTDKNAILRSGRTYTISFEVYADAVIPLTADINNQGLTTTVTGNDNDTVASRKMNTPSTIAGQWVKASVTFTMPSNLTQDFYDYTTIGVANGWVPSAATTIKIKNMKFEEGSRATDWIPSVEDTNSYIASVESTANKAKADIADMSNDSKLSPVEKSQLKKEWAVIQAEKPQYESLATTYGNTTEKTNYVNAYNALNAIVPGYLSSMSTTTSIDATTFRAKFDDYYDKKSQLIKAVTSKSKDIGDTANSKIDGLKIGGTNLVRNGDFGLNSMTQWANWATATRTIETIADLPNFSTAFKVVITAANQGLTQSIPTVVGTSYVVSGYLKSTDTGRGGLQIYNGGAYPSLYQSADKVGTNTWEKIEFSFVAASTSVTLQIGRGGGGANGTVFITGVQVEEGTRATAYSPSKWDVENRMDSIQVGVRNLFWNSDFEKGNQYWSTLAVTTAPTAQASTTGNPKELKFVTAAANSGVYQRSQGGTVSPYPTYTQNQDYTVSVEAKSDTAGTVMQIGLEGSFTQNVTLSTSYQTFTVTGKANGSSHTVIFYAKSNGVNVYIRRPKFEEGNRATTWAVAPEDTNSWIQDVSTVASGAASAASGAQSSANAAQDTANTAIAKIYDSYFDNGAKFWSQAYAGETTNAVPDNYTTILPIKGAGFSGGTALQLTANRNVYAKNAIPVDVNRTYKMRFRVKQTTDGTTANTSKVYAGVVTLDSSFNNITGGAGAHRYFAVSGVNITVADGWRLFEGTITGVGDLANNFRPGTAYVRPMFITNYSGGDGIALVDMIEFVDVTDAKAAQDSADSANSMINTNKNTWDKAGNFRSDGTLDVSKLYGQIEDTQIKGASDWNIVKSWTKDKVTIDGGNIAAGTIAATSMVLSDFTNLFENPTFEDDVVGQTPRGILPAGNGKTYDISSYTENQSSKAYAVDATNGYNSDTYAQNVIAVTPGQKFFVQADGRYINTAGGGRGRIGFRRWNGKKQVLNNWDEVVVWNTTSKEQTFTTRNGEYTVPDGCYYIQPWISFMNNAETTNKFLIDNVRIHRKSSAELLVDGSIITEKLASNSITTAKIATEGLDAKVIRTGTMSVGSAQLIPGTAWGVTGVPYSLSSGLSSSVVTDAGEDYLALAQTGSTELFAYLKRFPVVGGKTVTIGVEWGADSNVKSPLPEIFILASKGAYTTSNAATSGYDYVYVMSSTSGQNNSITDLGSGWQRMTKTFTLANDVKSAIIRIDHNGSSDGAKATMRLRSLMMNYGTVAMEWQPHTDESISYGVLEAKHIKANSITITELDNATTNKLSKLAADGKLATSNLTGTVSDSQVASSSAWNTSKNLTSAWVTNSTQINGGQIATSSITAKSLVLSDFSNLVENPTFEDDTVGQDPRGWFQNSGTKYSRVADISSFSSGNGSNKAYELEARNGGNSDVFTDLFIPVSEGQSFFMEAEGRYLNTAGTGYAFIGFREYDGKKAHVSWNLGAAWNTKSTTFSKQSYVYTVPAGIKYIVFRASFLDNKETTNRFYLDNVRVHRMGNAELIVDGSIQTNHMTTNSIDAKVIKSNTITATQIKASTITATEIASRTITANEIKANAITANEIKAGTITAAEIASTTISADKLRIGNFENLFQNGTFELGDTGWESGAQYFIQAGDNPFGNSKWYLRIPHNGGWNDIYDSHRIKVQAGEKYYLEGYFKVGSGTIADCRTFIIQQIDKDGVTTHWTPTESLNTSYRKFSYVYTVGATTTEMRIGCSVSGNNNTGTNTYVGQVLCKKMITGEMVVDGTLSITNLNSTDQTTINGAASNATAAKALTDAWKSSGAATTINGGMIETNSIVATQIAVGDFANLITANENFANTVNASGPYGGNKITSGYIAKPNAGNQYLMLTDYNANRLKNGDEIYFEFEGYAPVAGTVSPYIWFYNSSKGSVASYSGGSISLTTSNAKYSGTIKINTTSADGAAYYLIGFNGVTNVDLRIKKALFYKKASGSLLVDGSITASHINSLNGINVGNGQFVVDGSGNVTLGAGAKLTAVELTSAKFTGLRGNTIYLGDYGAKIDTSIAGTIKRTRFGTNDSTYLSIDDDGAFTFVTNNAFDCGIRPYASHYGLKLGSAIVKGLTTDATIQIRNYNDTAYANLAANDVIVTGNLSTWGRATVTGTDLTVQGTTSGMLKLKGSPYAYMEFYNGNTQVGFVGTEAASGSNSIMIQNNNAGEVLIKTGAVRVKFDKSVGQVVFKDQNDNGYVDVIGKSFVNSSQRAIKKNIEPFLGHEAPDGTFKTPLQQIVETTVSEYNFKTEEDHERKHVGLILDEAPVGVIDVRGSGVDTYAMASYSWGAIQELKAENDELKAQVEAQGKEIAEMKAMMQQMMDMMKK